MAKATLSLKKAQPLFSMEDNILLHAALALKFHGSYREVKDALKRLKASCKQRDDYLETIPLFDAYLGHEDIIHYTKTQLYQGVESRENSDGAQGTRK